MKIFRISTVPVSLNILLKGQLKYLSRYFNITAISGPGPDLDEVTAREGVNTHIISMERAISPVKDAVALVRLYNYFRREKPVIVHSITPKAGLLSMLAAKFAGVPVRIHTFTGLIFPSRTGVMQKLLIAMDRLLCWAATTVYPEGNGVKNDLQNYRITSKPLKVIGSGNVNGIDTSYFNPEVYGEDYKIALRRELDIPADAFVFVFVGRLVRDKGINELVSAFVQMTTPDAYLLLVGPFEQHLDPLTPQTIKEIESNPAIITVGFQKDVRPYLAVADLFVFPSYREGFPNVVMQAGAMGLVSVVTDINGSNEIVIPGENGIIVPPANIERLMHEMQNLKNHPEQLAAMQLKSRQLIINRYDQLTVWNLILKEYKDLTARLE